MNARANAIDEPDKVRELQEKLYLAAKNSKTRRMHALYDKVTREDFLVRAWEQVRKNRGGPGIDNESIRDIEEQGIDRVIKEIQAKLRNTRNYHPKPVKRVYIPKSGGGERGLGIPSVRDRIIQTSAKMVIEPIFEADFLDCSFGFRPNRSAHDALERIRLAMNAGYTTVLDADIKGFFDNIDQKLLLEFLTHRISDQRVLKLIRKWLRSGILERGTYQETDVGTPQGGVISPLLANVYLHEFDKFWMGQKEVEGVLVRYADDFVILFRKSPDAERGMELVKKKLAELRLELNEEKTKTVETAGGKDGFNFLGFHHRMVKSLKYKKFYSQKWPSQKAMKNIRTKVRDILSPRSMLPTSLEDVVKRINPTLRGWMNYFRFGNSAKKFATIDNYVHSRIALWWSKKHGRSGHRWKMGFNYDKLKESGIQRLSGNVIYWSYYVRMRKKEGHRRAV